MAKEAARKNWAHVPRYFARLVEGESSFRLGPGHKAAFYGRPGFRSSKPWTSFNGIGPRTSTVSINIQDLTSRSEAYRQKGQYFIFLGGSSALGRLPFGSSARLHRMSGRPGSVLFTSAIDVINTLSAAHAAGQLKRELKKYTKPSLLILDELGYLPIDKKGADLLFQIISLRYE